MTAHSCNRTRDCKPETEAQYRPALELYAATDLSYVEICRLSEVSLNGFTRYVCTFHCLLMLKRNDIKCIPEEAGNIKMN